VKGSGREVNISSTTPHEVISKHSLSLSFIYTNSCAFSYNYVSVF